MSSSKHISAAKPQATSSGQGQCPRSPLGTDSPTQPIYADGEIPSAITRRIYVSHFLSTWNFRGFEFGAVLFLASIFPGTLFPMSCYALIRSASAIFLAPALGRYIDQGNRLTVVRVSIIYQRLAIVLSCAIFWIMLTQSKKLSNAVSFVLLALNVVLACVERLCSTMNTVSVERDWVVVIAGSNKSILRKLNSQMRRIDLFCKLASPLIIALIAGISTQMAILVSLGINAVSMVVEYVLIARVYQLIPALAESRMLSTYADSVTDNSSLASSIAKHIGSAVDNLRIYASQNAFLPSLSLSILYLTVLSFGGQMVTYLLAAGYTSAIVGIVRVGSSVCEMSATWMAPWLMKKIGPIRAGLWFLSFQMICLGFAVLAFWRLSTPVMAASALVIGTALSRIGLWGFDLSAQIIIQEEVQPEYRGTFSTTEAALQNFFELCAGASTIMFSRPVEFKYPAIISIGAVYIAGVLYAKFVRDRRGHLLHVLDCVKSRDKLRQGYQQIPSNRG
ncbi:hypothetical protein TRVA0_064S00122 [Trichomonascus vanleenenianus]|uniref:uncharacterized protein n=1 Tax=Trichomonascus vanleenenianus TaxID=2268995 RepID=UPI003ECA92FA